jgi:hypothetical protein
MQMNMNPSTATPAATSIAAPLASSMFRSQFLQLFLRCAIGTLENHWYNVKWKSNQKWQRVACWYNLASFHSTSDIEPLSSSSTHARNKSFLQSTASTRLIPIVPYAWTWITYPPRKNCHRQHCQHLGVQRREVHPYIDLSIKSISSSE